MDFSSLTKQQLEQNLEQLRSGVAVGEPLARWDETVQDLQVHRVELEMQNRALRETQKELELAVRRYADLYDHLPVGYITVNEDGQILHANLATAEMLQRERDRVVGQFVRKFLDPYEAGRFAAHLEACCQKGQPGIMEVTLRVREGYSRAVQLSSRLAPPDGSGGVHVLIAITDITKLKDAQHVLEDINREQEAFNYSISHDLRAPLVTISNYASILLEEHSEQLQPEGTGLVERIGSAAGRMEATLKSLLEYSMIGRHDVVLQTVITDELVREVLIEHRGLIQEKHAEISVARPLPAVQGSPVLLSQVLSNLLTNAFKYTQPDQPPRVHIAAEAREGLVVLRFSDQGIGIEPKYHERVFRIFERLHGYSRFPGTGVGLAIARRAVERMNGRIWVESEPGKGACFCVELPKARGTGR